MLALVTMTGLYSCERKEVISLTASIQANKTEAKRILDDRIAANTKREAADKEFSIGVQRDYDNALKTLSATNTAYAGKLRDPGRNRSACPGAKESPVTSVPQSPSTGSELSETFGKFLRGEADRADLAAIYAAECRKVAIKDQP